MSKFRFDRTQTLEFLRAIHKAKNLDLSGYNEVENPEYLRYIEYEYPDALFYFALTNVTLQNDHTVYHIEYRPASSTDLGVAKTKFVEDNFYLSLISWHKLVEEISFYVGELAPREDVILEEYEKDEYAYFEMLNEDLNLEDKHSYPLPFQLFLDAYLDDVIKRLEIAQESNDSDESKKEEIQEVIGEARKLKASQTKKTQAQVNRKLADLWAKARRAGLDVYTEVRKEAFKEAIKFFTRIALDPSTSFEEYIKGILES
ncbi:hypothetical protein [Spirosoma sp. KUDC1026]|uniref:hypothetical protein n=1 Tax=Spirosoma sp. KUDC1026 TaxID=2745947 RepID=UPI00159B9E00|nr:hypothetical protein [Spirosoma sp. KUDC1026]QKZ12502.1 hypothetical protein HU175_07610 [Spirosoma sp. KUDC1026]